MAKFEVNFFSYVMKRAVDITVVVPTMTFAEAMAPQPDHTPKAPYPVIYLLHGTGNNHGIWPDYTKAILYAEEYQIALVCMSAENRDYVDNGDDDYMRFLEEELPNFVTGMFPISRRPEDTYIAGLSMGGFGTLVHALRYPEKYAAFGAFSAGINPEQCPTDPTGLQEYYLPNPKGMRPYPRGYRKDINPYCLIDKVKEDGKAYPKAYMSCGTKDGLYKHDLAFCESLKEHGADVTWNEREGYGHEWRFWDLELESFIKWLPRTDYYKDIVPRNA